jgi:hypothetical protein
MGLLIGRREQVLALVGMSTARWFVFGAGVLLGLQALAVNLAFSRYGQPTLSNVVYSSRGLMAVAFLYWVLKRGDPSLIKEQMLGAALMVIALALVLGG